MCTRVFACVCVRACVCIFVCIYGSQCVSVCLHAPVFCQCVCIFLPFCVYEYVSFRVFVYLLTLLKLSSRPIARGPGGSAPPEVSKCSLVPPWENAIVVITVFLFCFSAF